MRITFHGAAQTVTGSQHLIEANGHKILLECGLFQGHRKQAFEINRNFPYEPTEIDAVILSHAHIDHSGNLPHLVKKGYEGEIYCTPATAHLSNIMLMDSGHIHESDAKYINKKRSRKGEEPIEPLYTQTDAAAVAQQFEPRQLYRAFEPVPGVTAMFHEAGHILGSAAISLDIEENGTTERLWFSGDIGRNDLPLLKDPDMPARADYMIMECTYGDKAHKPPEQAHDEFREVLQRTIQRGGRVIIPSFAVGRTQELVYSLHRMIEAGDIPRIPVFVDSPLAINATEIFSAHPECFDRETLEFIRKSPYHAALGHDMISYTRSVEQSKAINYAKGPVVIISASGMAETGRILHHLKNNITEPENTILIVSWQAPHTLGRRLAEQEKEVRIFGETYIRQAEVVTINGFSAHGGQSMLVDYAKAVQDTVKKIFLVHGESRGADPLMEKLGEVGMDDVYFPEPHSSFEV